MANQFKNYSKARYERIQLLPSNAKHLAEPSLKSDMAEAEGFPYGGTIYRRKA